MPAEVIDGSRIADDICDELRPRVAELAGHRIRPGFAVVHIGDDPREHGHARRKVLVCEDLGMRANMFLLPSSTPETQVLGMVEDLNRDDLTHGILVQLPLPSHINAVRVLNRVDPRKDVDGYHPLNMGMVASGYPAGRPRAAALAIRQILVRMGIVIRGARVVVLGHTNEVARPVATLLSQEVPGGGAAVTLCPEWTRDLPEVTREADVLIAAVGRPEFVSGDMVRSGAVVIDAGAHRAPPGHRDEDLMVIGDVQFHEVREIARAISPVPGGVGPVTIAALVLNTVEAAEACPRN